MDYSIHIYICYKYLYSPPSNQILSIECVYIYVNRSVDIYFHIYVVSICLNVQNLCTCTGDHHAAMQGCNANTTIFISFTCRLVTDDHQLCPQWTKAKPHVTCKCRPFLHVVLSCRTFKKVPHLIHSLCVLRLPSAMIVCCIYVYTEYHRDRINCTQCI